MFLVIIFKFFHSSVSAAAAQTPRCLIPGRKSWSSKQGRHTCSVRKNVFRVLSECPTALSKQMHWISALYCCLVAQYPKQTFSNFVCVRVSLTNDPILPLPGKVVNLYYCTQTEHHMGSTQAPPSSQHPFLPLFQQFSES